MSALVFKTKKRAIEVCKIMLREQNNVKKLTRQFTKDISMQCNCGETPAIAVVTILNGIAKSEFCGICEICGAD